MAAPAYLDYNATAPVRPAAIEAMAAALQETGNPSSVHRFGRAARRAIEIARERVAALVGAAGARVIFTAGGTEANNLALAVPGRRLLVSAVEHDSVLRPAGDAARIPVDGDGIVDVAALERMLAGAPPALVAVMLANNETGAIQPVAEVARLAHAHGALVHCDAAQAAGKIAIDWSALGVESLALSAHKLGGPQGVGALIVAETVEMQPLLRGGGQERGLRAGTENVAGVVGFGVAAEIAARELDAMVELARLRDDMEKRLARVVPALAVPGSGAPRLPNTSCLAMPGVAAETQVMALDLAGVAVSAGAACSSGKVRASHVLAAMGLPESIAGSAIRVSTGWSTMPAEIDRFVEVWTSLWARLGAARVGDAAPAA